MLTGNSKCSQEIRFKTRVSARTIYLMHMSDGVLFTGLMEVHSIGDLEMLTGNSIQHTSVSSHHMSDGVLFRDQLRTGRLDERFGLWQ